ncbi:MAG: adenylyltransferase/cytidyltransferase family protein [Lentisphaeria bacterium]|nr:adenylyltransferase/cytidyltransferase family protein [Lentisphaeria bacterium]
MNDNKFDVKDNLLTLDEAIEWRRKLRGENKKLVVSNGCFDLLHRGHAEYLNESRSLGDALLILLNSDESVNFLKGENRPINDELSRAYLLLSLRAVDRVVIFDGSTCHDELAKFQPDIYVKGGDYTLDTMNPLERTALMDAGSIIYFKPFIKGYSTTSIIEKMQK